MGFMRDISQEKLRIRFNKSVAISAAHADSVATGGLMRSLCPRGAVFSLMSQRLTGFVFHWWDLQAPLLEM